MLPDRVCFFFLSYYVTCNHGGPENVWRAKYFFLVHMKTEVTSSRLFGVDFLRCAGTNQIGTALPCSFLFRSELYSTSTDFTTTDISEYCQYQRGL